MLPARVLPTTTLCGSHTSYLHSLHVIFRKAEPHFFECNETRFLEFLLELSNERRMLYARCTVRLGLCSAQHPPPRPPRCQFCAKRNPHRSHTFSEGGV
jgi:hypothetical protein